MRRQKEVFVERKETVVSLVSQGMKSSINYHVIKTNSILETRSVTGLVFQNYNSLISCGAGDGLIKVWDLRRHYSVHSHNPMPNYIIPYSGKSTKMGYSNLLVDSSGKQIC